MSLRSVGAVGLTHFCGGSIIGFIKHPKDSEKRNIFDKLSHFRWKLGFDRCPLLCWPGFFLSKNFKHAMLCLQWSILSQKQPTPISKLKNSAFHTLVTFLQFFNLQSQNVRSRPLCTLLPEESSWTTLKMRRSQGFYLDNWFIIKHTHNSWLYTQQRNAQDCFCEKGLKSFLIVATHKESWRNYWTSWLLCSHYFKWCVPA